jgi:undecaprenyl-phosphate 4-deoxy-4-formamido-L-arabinose transferase
LSGIEYSVVVPVYGSVNSLELLHKSICEFFNNKYTFEIIYVNDDSPDDSWEVLKKIKQSSSQVTIVSLSKNFGQHGATMCGFKHAAGRFVITMDDDMEVHPGTIEKLIAAQQKTDSDLVYGVYPKLNQSFLRKNLTAIYKLLSKTEGSQKGKGSSFRLMKGSLAKKLADNHKHFVFIDELCLWYTSKIDFIDVEPNKNFIDKKRYTIRSLFSLTANVILFSSTFPLKFVTRIGITLSLVNFIIGMFYLYKKIFLKTKVDGYTSLIVSIMFSTGLIIFSIGIIAQYLSQVLKSINNSPSYSEREVL